MRIKTTLTITKKGSLATGTYFKNVKPALIRAADRVGKIVKEESQKAYMNKRKTDKVPSFIFDSFSHSTLSFVNMSVYAIIFAGGPTAPYAPFVNDGHGLRNGKKWTGYKFMEIGFKKGVDVMSSIAFEELNKIDNNIITSKTYKF